MKSKKNNYLKIGTKNKNISLYKNEEEMKKDLGYSIKDNCKIGIYPIKSLVNFTGKATSEGYMSIILGNEKEIRVPIYKNDKPKDIENRLNEAIVEDIGNRLNEAIVDFENNNFEHKMQLIEKTLSKLDKQTNGLLRELGLYDKLQKVEKENTKLRSIINHVIQEMSRGNVDQNELFVYLKNEMIDKPEKKIISSECEK